MTILGEISLVRNPKNKQNKQQSVIKLSHTHTHTITTNTNTNTRPQIVTAVPGDFAVQRLAFTALLRRKVFQYHKRTCLHLQTEKVWLANPSIHHSDFVSYSTEPPFLMFLVCDAVHLPGAACFNKTRVVDLTMSESSLRQDLLQRVAEAADKSVQLRWEKYQVR